MKILDCTLRDGGYYTNWDFSEGLVESYINATNHLPIDYIEIGYRSNPMNVYRGEYFYCPLYLIERIRKQSLKKVAIMINEKEIVIEDLIKLLSPIKGLVDLIRIAVDPKNLNRALKLAEQIKLMGFKIGFNLMYMSKWTEDINFIDNLNKIGDNIDYFNMVDSFGGIYPKDIKEICRIVRSKIRSQIGFHGHNNLELGLINSLTAIDYGVDIIDSTFTGMGRGAGNLKTELLLTALNSKGKLNFDFNELSSIVDEFNKLQISYGWGTSLPYMVSGANSLPQKDVMEWVGKRFYSYNSIIRALNNHSNGVLDNINLNEFNPKQTINKVLIIGGGISGTKHSKAIKEYLKKHKEVAIIHVSSKNVKPYVELDNLQIHCISGNEGYRLEKTFSKLNADNRIAILPPFPRKMGTYIPSLFKDNIFQLPKISFTNKQTDSVTAIAIQVAINLKALELLFVGYDGYSENVSSIELDLFNENEDLFSKLKRIKVKFYSITETKYKAIPENSIYTFL